MAAAKLLSVFSFLFYPFRRCGNAADCCIFAAERQRQSYGSLYIRTETADSSAYFFCTVRQQICASSQDGVHFSQMRICHMHEGGGRIRFGIYACSPEESSFRAVFTDMQITECAWNAHDGQQPDDAL